VLREAACGARDHLLAFCDAQIWAAARLKQTQVIFREGFQHGQVLEGV
jgi:predicted nucleic acid-binding protein